MTDTAQDRRARRAAAAIVALAALLRAPGLWRAFPVDDEFMQFFEALHPARWRDFFRLPAQNPHHLLLDALGTFAASRVSGSLWCLRLPSLLWGAAAVFGLWRLGLLAGSRARALAASFLLAVSLLHIDWSRRCDFYALLGALSVFSALAYLRLCEGPERKTPYAVCAILFAYGHPYFAAAAALHFISAALDLERSKRSAVLRALAVCWAAAGACFLPWFLYSTRSLLDRAIFGVQRAPGMLTLGEFLWRMPLFLGQAPEAGPLRQWGLNAPSFLSAVYAAFYAISLGRTLTGNSGPALRFAHRAVPGASQ